MSSLTERQAQAEIPRLLEQLVGAPATVEHARGSKAGPDLIVKVGKFTFVVEIRGCGDVASVWRATQVLHDQVVHRAGSTLPIVAVPYMGEPGRTLCEQEGIGWLDLSGNAHLTAPGLRVHVDGRPNQFKRRGRPANVFAPKSARISRRLLLEPERFWSQRELARAAGVNEGLTSRVVRKLEEEELIERKSSGEVRPRSPGRLLDAWCETYEFENNRIIRGYVLARSGAELLRRLAGSLTQQGVHHAMTGLGAAWQATRFANFLTATVYLQEPPRDELMEALGFRREERGGNVWLVVPADAGVFDGEEDRDGIRCVSAVQVYLDLKGHPERSKEAAEHLRRELLGWRVNDRKAG